MQGGKREKSNMKNSRGKKLLDTFRVLPGVHFMHTISHFKAWEFRSPTLQTVHELELKWRSYGRLKTTTSSCTKWAAEISQLRNELRNPPLAHECHFAAHASIFTAANHVAKSPPSCESSLSCGIIFKLWNHLQVAKPKLKLAKWIIQHVNHLVKSTCLNLDICNRLS